MSAKAARCVRIVSRQACPVSRLPGCYCQVRRCCSNRLRRCIASRHSYARTRVEFLGQGFRISLVPLAGQGQAHSDLQPGVKIIGMSRCVIAVLLPRRHGERLDRA